MFVRELNPYQMKIIQEFFSTKGQTIMSWMRECVLWSDADPLCRGPPKQPSLPGLVATPNQVLVMWSGGSG